MRIIFFVGFGLLPLWAALAFVIFGFATMESDQAGMTLWSFIPAIPACAVTVSIAAVTLAIHSRTIGNKLRKLGMSAAFLVAATAFLACIVFAFWMKRQANENSLNLEKTKVEEFVKNNEAVRTAAGEPLSLVYICSYSMDKSGPMPKVYDVSVKGQKQIYAIVNVDRQNKLVTFKLACTTSLYMGQRDASKGACEQGR